MEIFLDVAEYALDRVFIERPQRWLGACAPSRTFAFALALAFALEVTTGPRFLFFCGNTHISKGFMYNKKDKNFPGGVTLKAT